MQVVVQDAAADGIQRELGIFGHRERTIVLGVHRVISHRHIQALALRGAVVIYQNHVESLAQTGVIDRLGVEFVIQQRVAVRDRPCPRCRVKDHTGNHQTVAQATRDRCRQRGHHAIMNQLNIAHLQALHPIRRAEREALVDRQ